MVTPGGRSFSPGGPLLRSGVSSLPALRPSLSVSRALLLALILAAALSGPPAAATAQTILNVERLQSREARGWHAGVEGSLDVGRGNSDHTNLLAGVAAGYRWQADWLRLFAAMSYRDKDGGGLDNDRYLHLRYNHDWATKLQSFHFVQVQASRTSKLRDRLLVGSGLRLRLVGTDRTTFDVGAGAMVEREQLDAAGVLDEDPALTRTVRMTSLLVLDQRLRTDVRIVGVGYLQPRFDDFGDTRALSDLSLLIALTDEVDLAVRLQWRRDTRPPGGVERDDLSFTTGFTVALR